MIFADSGGQAAPDYLSALLPEIKALVAHATELQCTRSFSA